MIEFENVSKSFWTGKRRKVILDRASFKVELGNSLGILAPNGTGKTTIINMMAGLEQPDEGKITRSSRISFPLGFMGGVVSRHSATENSRYIARLYGLEDRGVLAPGYLADVNVIDFEGLRLHGPEVVSDLPAGGRRIQRPDASD